MTKKRNNMDSLMIAMERNIYLIYSTKTLTLLRVIPYLVMMDINYLEQHMGMDVWQVCMMELSLLLKGFIIRMIITTDFRRYADWIRTLIL
jgi:hypothetical protein